MTYRQIAGIAGCSPGAVRAMKSEKVYAVEKEDIEQVPELMINQQGMEFEITRF